MLFRSLRPPVLMLLDRLVELLQVVIGQGRLRTGPSGRGIMFSEASESSGLAEPIPDAVPVLFVGEGHHLRRANGAAGPTGHAGDVVELELATGDVFDGLGQRLASRGLAPGEGKVVFVKVLEGSEDALGGVEIGRASCRERV